MAEKKENQVEEQKEESGKKGFPVKIVILGVLVLVLTGGGVFAWKGGWLDSLKGKSQEAIATEGTDGKTQGDIGPIFSLDTFIVNLSDPRGKRYLKAKLELEMNKEEMRMEIERRLPQFRDAILTVLSSKTYEDINHLEGKYQLRAEIMSILNQYLKSGKIQNIYLTEFIVQ